MSNGGRVESFAKFRDVERLLGIAQHHLRLATAARRRRVLWSDHALVTSVFSAAAVEIGLNLFIVSPVLFIRDGVLRKFYGDFLTRAARPSTHDKLEFVRRVCPEIGSPLLKQLRELFTYRNRLLHGSQEYAESRAIRRSVIKRARHSEPTTLAEEDFQMVPTLIGRGGSSLEIDDAREHYAAAREFFTRLKPVVPVRRSRGPKGK